LWFSGGAIRGRRQGKSQTKDWAHRREELRNGCEGRTPLFTREYASVRGTKNLKGKERD